MNVKNLVPAALKPRLKRLRARLRSRYVTRFHSFSASDFEKSLQAVGIQPGDVVFIHSSYDRFLGFQGSLVDAVRILQEAVTPQGGLLMPTLPFSGSAVDYVREHPITDLRSSPSRTGLMTEMFRRASDVVRSISPTHPVAAWGQKGRAIVGDDYRAQTPCGRGTAFHRLLGCGGKILFLGTPINTMTFFHCVEELLEPQMPFSPFTSEEFTLQTKDMEGRIHTSKMRLFDQSYADRRDLSCLPPVLRKRGYWKQSRVGRLRIVLLEAEHVLETCRFLALTGRYCYRSR